MACDANATGSTMAASHLLQLGEDQQRAIFQLLSNALRPAVALQLSACCRELRDVSESGRTELRQRYGAARRLCYQVRESVTAVSEARELLWYGQGLTAAHLATLRMLMSTNALPQLNVLAEEIVCLPVGWWLTDDDRRRIVAAVKEFSTKVAVTTLSPAVSTRQRKKWA